MCNMLRHVEKRSKIPNLIQVNQNPELSTGIGDELEEVIKGLTVCHILEYQESILDGEVV